jgi:hypothetical protein
MISISTVKPLNLFPYVSHSGNYPSFLPLPRNCPHNVLHMGCIFFPCQSFRILVLTHSISRMTVWRKIDKVFEVFGHSLVPGITEFWNESNKIILEHTVAKNLPIPTTVSHSCRVLDCYHISAKCGMSAELQRWGIILNVFHRLQQLMAVCSLL